MTASEQHGNSGVCPRGLAHLIGWCALALTNAVFIAMARLPRAGLAARVAHHFFDAGQLLAVGLFVQIGIVAWQRWGPRRAVWGYLVAVVLAAVLGLLVLPADLVGLVTDILGREATEATARPAAVAASLVVPAAAIAGALVSRPYLRWVGVVAGLGAAVANNLVLKGDYRGIHVIVGVAAATLIGASLTGAVLPTRLAAIRARLARPVPRTIARIAVASVAALAVVAPPRQPVRVEMFKIDGAIVAPLLAWHRTSSAVAYASDSPWFQKRDGAGDVPPSTPPLVGKGPIVVLVTMDSVRAEVLATPKYAAKIPRLRKLADESIDFLEARSVGSGTVVTFASLFAGRHPFQLKWGQEGKRANLDKDPTVRFTELLSRAGVRTVTFTSYPPLLPKNGLIRGFDEATLVPPPKGQRFALAKQMLDAAVGRIQTHDGGPMFLFLHLMDPHHPYDAAGKAGSPFDRYVAEVGLCSEAIGRLVDALQEKGLWSKTVLIVAADHGEGFNKHGVEFHNLGLYEEILHVPLFFHVPGAGARKIETPVSTLDLPPTILDLYGIATPGFYMGESLVGFLRGENPKLGRPIVSSTLFSSNAMYSFPLKVIVDKKNGSVEVYDLERDPEEQDNLADDVGGKMEGMLGAFMDAHHVR